MTTQMSIRLDSEVKSKITKLAHIEGKRASQVVRELIEKSLRERELGAYVDDLWNRVGKKLTSREVALKDIERTIREVRMGKL